MLQYARDPRVLALLKLLEQLKDKVVELFIVERAVGPRPRPIA